MKTEKYRVRKTLLGKCILQQLCDYPSFIGGQVDSATRDYLWEDVDFSDLENIVFRQVKL